MDIWIIAGCVVFFGGLMLRAAALRRRRADSLRRGDDGRYYWTGFDGTPQSSDKDPRPPDGEWAHYGGGDGDGGGDGGGD